MVADTALINVKHNGQICGSGRIEKQPAVWDVKGDIVPAGSPTPPRTSSRATQAICLVDLHRVKRELEATIAANVAGILGA